MTRIALIADSHFDEHSRFEECLRIHDWIADDMLARRVNLILHAGDVFERKSTPTERQAVARWLRAVTEIAPVVIVRGNHEAPLDLTLFARLKTTHPIIVEEAAAVHVVAGVAVACLAWPQKARLLSYLPDASRETGDQAARDALHAVLRGLGAEMADHDGPRVLLAHAMINGARTSAGQPLIGVDLTLGLEDLTLVNADFVALGHIHMHQAWEHGGVPIVYPGAPRRTDFGMTHPVGYVVAEVEHGAAKWEFIEAPAVRMIQLAATFEAGRLVVQETANA